MAVQQIKINTATQHIHVSNIEDAEIHTAKQMAKWNLGSNNATHLKHPPSENYHQPLAEGKITLALEYT